MFLATNLEYDQGHFEMEKGMQSNKKHLAKRKIPKDDLQPLYNK